MANYIVTTLTDEGDAGASVLSPGGAGLSLREAIALANSSIGVADAITFASNLSGGTMRLSNAAGTLNVTDALTINGDIGNDGTPNVTISGDVLGNDAHQTGSTTLTDVSGSLATVVGGGNALTDNVRVLNVTADLILDGLIVTGGHAGTGDGGAVLSTQTLTVLASWLTGNKAAAGGAIKGATVGVTGSTISANFAASSSATSPDGGGIWALDVTLTNTTLSGNNAGWIAGGLLALDSATLTNTTVTGNTATRAMGGISFGGLVGNGVYHVENSIVQGNIAIQIPILNDYGQRGTLYFDDANVIDDDIWLNGFDIGDITTAAVFAQTADIDPGAGTVLGGVLADNGGGIPTVALRLDASNPALDAATGSVPATDARNLPRFDLAVIGPVGQGPADLGAYEVFNAAPTVSLTNLHGPISENASTTIAVKFADITVTDTDGGTNVLSLSGDDAGLFEIVNNNELFLKAGAVLDFLSNPVLNVSVDADSTLSQPAVDGSASASFDVLDALNFIAGSQKRDTLAGDDTANDITGLGSKDILTGNGGNDRIIGGRGSDVLSGGLGDDIFVFLDVNDGKDTILDFTQGDDTIDLSAIDANSRTVGDDAFNFLGAGKFTKTAGELIFKQADYTDNTKDKTIIQGDTNGDGKSDFEIKLAGLYSLQAVDFVL